MPVKVEGDAKTSLILTSWFDFECDYPKVKSGLTAFNEISGLALEITVIEKTETDHLGNTYTSKLAGVPDYKEITMKRNLTADNGFWLWMKDIRDGKEDFRHAGAIVLYSTADKEIGRWEFTNAWPSKWSASDLDAGSDDVIVEEVVMQIEMLKRVK